MMLKQLKIDDERILNYQLADEQLQFTMHPKEANTLAKTDNERYLIGWEENEEIPTFFVLHEGKGVKPFSDNTNALLLRSFSTDHRFLGKGFAKQSLLSLPDFVQQHFTTFDEIVLAVNYNNTVAQSLYFSTGFKDFGVRRQGRNGELYILNLKLQ